MDKIRKTKQDMDLLTGPIWNKMLKFAIPLAATSILQQLFNAADVAVVGKFAGKTATAAVGSNAPLIGLLVNIFIGLALGANVVIARFIGAKDEAQIRKGIHTAIVVGGVGGLILMLTGILMTPYMLDLVKVPGNVKPLANTYLRIFFLGMPFSVIYNFESAIFRSRGNTKTPLYCLTVSGIINVLLNLFLVAKLNMSVAGVATATTIAMAVSSGLLFMILLREKGTYGIRFKELRVEKSIFVNIMKIGLPSGIQGMVFSLSNLVIQSAINSLGADTMAASAIAFYIDISIFFVLSAFSQATTTFISQNYGAGKLKRCRDVAKVGITMNLFFTVTLSLLLLYFDKNILRVFTSDAAVLALAHTRLFILFTTQGLNCTNETMSAILRGLGNSFSPAVISLIFICGTRILWVYTGFQHFKTFQSLIFSYPISWGLSLVLLILIYARVRREKLLTNKDTGDKIANIVNN